MVQSHRDMFEISNVTMVVTAWPRLSRSDERGSQSCAGGSVNDHYLGSYQQALLAVCLSQFSSKRYRTGMLGVLHLAEASPPFAYLFQKELGLSLEDMERMSRCPPPPPSPHLHPHGPYLLLKACPLHEAEAKPSISYSSGRTGSVSQSQGTYEQVRPPPPPPPPPPARTFPKCILMLHIWLEKPMVCT